MKKSCDEGLDGLSSQCYLGFDEAQTEGTAEMSYRFEDQGPTIPARFQTMPLEVREAFDMERAKATFWLCLAIPACVIGIVGILL